MTTDEIATVLLNRVAGNGLKIRRWDPIPPLPYDISHVLTHTNGHRHICEHDRCVELPLVLVCDVHLFPDEPVLDAPLYTIEPCERFTPYWLGGVRVIHDWVPYPEPPFRPVTPIEAACIFAQYPYLGSVKAHLNWPGWSHSSIQVYHRPNTHNVVFSPFGHRGYNHHAAFCQYTIGFQGASTRSVMLPLPSPIPAPPPPSSVSPHNPPPSAAPPVATKKKKIKKKRAPGKKDKK